MIVEFLAQHGIPFERVDHPPVYTCEEARLLVPPISGAETKNLFLRDKAGTRHFLVAVPAAKKISLQSLAQVLEVSKLSFASADRLSRYLKLEPGSVTLLGVINDPDGKVEVVIDQTLWSQDALLCHPLVNTSTLSIAREGVFRFLELTGHSPKIVVVPEALE